MTDPGPSERAERRELKRQYKESYRPTGVFRLRNRESGRLLLGSSVNLPATWNKLRMQLATGSYLMHPELQREWKELGEEAFEFEVLEELDPPDTPGWNPTDDLEALLALWMEQLQPYGEKGYHREPKA